MGGMRYVPVHCTALWKKKQFVLSSFHYLKPFLPSILVFIFTLKQILRFGDSYEIFFYSAVGRFSPTDCTWEGLKFIKYKAPRQKGMPLLLIWVYLKYIC
jgi:hypothetical protein